MTYLTTRPLALNLSHGGSPRLQYPFVLPKGSRVDLVPDLSGTEGAGFVCGDVRQIAELSGNAHDAAHHYTQVPANAVQGVTPEEQRRVAELIAKEAAISAERAARLPAPQPYLQAYAVTCVSGAVYLVLQYAPARVHEGDKAEQMANDAALALEGPGGEVWGLCAYPVRPELRALGPCVLPLFGGLPELSPFWVTGEDRERHALGVGDKFSCMVWASNESDARDAAITRRCFEGRENIQFRAVVTHTGGALA